MTIINPIRKDKPRVCGQLANQARIAASCRTGLGKTLIECDTARIEHGSRLHIRPEHFESVRKGLGLA